MSRLAAVWSPETNTAGCSYSDRLAVNPLPLSTGTG